MIRIEKDNLNAMKVLVNIYFLTEKGNHRLEVS